MTQWQSCALASLKVLLIQIKLAFTCSNMHSVVAVQDRNTTIFLLVSLLFYFGAAHVSWVCIGCVCVSPVSSVIRQKMCQHMLVLQLTLLSMNYSLHMMYNTKRLPE